MKITIDREKCIGCGSCVAVCEEAFELDEEGKASLKEGYEEFPCLEEAKEICPVEAVKEQE